MSIRLPFCWTIPPPPSPCLPLSVSPPLCVFSFMFYSLFLSLSLCLSFSLSLVSHSLIVFFSYTNLCSASVLETRVRFPEKYLFRFPVSFCSSCKYSRTHALSLLHFSSHTGLFFFSFSVLCTILLFLSFSLTRLHSRVIALSLTLSLAFFLTHFSGHSLACSCPSSFCRSLLD